MSVPAAELVDQKMASKKECGWGRRWGNGKECDGNEEDLTRYQRKKKCFCTVLAVLLIGGLIFWAIDDAIDRRHTYPAACFVDLDDSPSEIAEDVADTVQDVLDECASQLESFCGLPADASAKSSFEWQLCIAEKYLDLNTDCREELTQSSLFNPVLFPSSLRNKTAVEEAEDACEKDARRHCDDVVDDFDDENLCQVYEVGLCLTKKVNKISEKCREKIAVFNFTLPPDYDEDDFTFRIKQTKHHGPGWALWVLFSVLIFFAVRYWIIRRRRAIEEKENTLNEAKVVTKSRGSTSMDYIAYKDEGQV